TNLTGKYPDNANTRLLSPAIPLPALTGNERVQLSFYHYFDTWSTNDYCDVEVSANGGAWVKLNPESFKYQSGGWTHYLVDLSAYGNQTVQIAFHFVSDNGTANAGWYVDKVSIRLETIMFNIPKIEDFFSDAEGWYASNGVWQVGQPTYAFGPNAAHSSPKCLGTILNGSYPNNAQSRFVSPEFYLGANDINNPPRLIFWHWYKIKNQDEGNIQISLDGGAWQNFSASFTGDKPNWSKDSVSLIAYLGHFVRIAFNFESNNSSADAGWYIDDLEFIGICESPINVGIVSILSPSGIVNKDTILTPKVIVKNYGTEVAVFELSLSIGSLYSIDTILAQPGLALDTLFFQPFLAIQAGTFPFNCSINFANDPCASNDEFSVNLTVSPGQGPLITSIIPNTGGNTGSVTTEIHGKFFQPGIETYLKKGQNNIFAYNVEWLDAEKLYASFDLSGQEQGFYDVWVRNPDFQQATFFDGFEIVDGSIGWGGFASSSCPATDFEVGQLLEIEIQRPAGARPNRVVPMTVHYHNTGNIDLPLPTRVLTNLNGAFIAFTESGLSENKTELFLEFREQGGPDNVLRAGTSGSIKFYVKTPPTAQTLEFRLME
ncbi:MAG: choice-of-anchor J domain-containing protein, partial [Saprospiraceae bacterium]